MKFAPRETEKYNDTTAQLEEREVLLPGDNGSVRGSRFNALSLSKVDFASAEMSVHSEEPETVPILDTLSEPGPCARQSTFADQLRRPFGWFPYEIKKKEMQIKKIVTITSAVWRKIQ